MSSTPPDQQHRDEQFRILHWNIHSWRDGADASNVGAVAALVAEIDPHIVSLVEIDESWGMPDALRDLAESHGYAWLFTPSFEFGDGEPAGGFGNALLTKLPILAVQQWQLLWPPRLYDGTESSEDRSVVLARLRLGSVPMWVGSTHMPRSDAVARADALKRLTVLTGRLSDPWLVCGDFNVSASSWLDKEQSLTTCPQPAKPTYPADWPVEAIDYCVASPELQVNGDVLSVAGSDHLPVMFSGCLVGDPQGT